MLVTCNSLHPKSDHGEEKIVENLLNESPKFFFSALLLSLYVWDLKSNFEAEFMAEMLLNNE